MFGYSYYEIWTPIIIMQVKKHYACLRIPPVCAEWVNKMETRWREENITR